MMRGVLRALVAAALGLLDVAGARAQEAPTPELADPAVHVRFVHLAQGVPGAFYEPAAPGPRAATAVFIMHSSADYLSFSGCAELARRGFRVLCANNSTSKAGAANEGMLDRVLLDAKAGVAWLRRQPGISHVALLGHSGGGTVMSAYQMIAEGGVKACNGPEKIWKCPDSLAGLPPADALMLIDSNWGLAEMTLFSIDPAVTDEASGKAIDPALDLFNPANGFVAAGSRFPAAFVRAFQAAEGRRAAALLTRANTRFAAITKGQGAYDDDEPFVVPGAILLGGNNRLFAQDTGLMAHTRGAYPLLHADGSTTTQVVPSVRVPENTTNLSPSLMRGALKTTVRGYLSTYAIRVEPDFGYDADSVHGIDWTSTYASPPGNVGGIAAPLLVTGMTGHWEYLAAETIFRRAASADKTIAFVEGADHLYNACDRCGAVPGQYGDTRKRVYDFIADWLSQPRRFPASPAPARAAAF